jgi:hypothetical protein
VSKGAKVPQDHKQKGAADRLRDEASRLPGMDELAGLTLTVTGRNGEVTVTALDNPLDWDAEVIPSLREGDYLSAICGVLSTEDAARVRAVRPSIGSLLTALMEPAEESSEPSVGESQAS